jgi:hypothetical protein
MINALLKRFRRTAQAEESQDPTAAIDRLMAGPIKERPKITIFGDDDVVGINPAPVVPSNEN